MNKINNDRKLQIINLYKDGMKCQEIADIFDITKVRVSQIAREAGLKRQDKILNYSIDEVKIMYDMYIDGFKAEEIANIYGFNRASVYNLFDKYGFALDLDKHRKYSVNDTYFDKIDTSNKAYCLGFLWADGHNNTKKGIVEMRLQETDKHILQDISRDMQNDRPLYFVTDNKLNHQDAYRMYITSRRISNSLLNYGMSSNKTYILEWPKNLDDELIPHFLRGFTDGDGSIYNNGISWVGTQMMMEKIQNILYDVFGIECKIYNTKNDIIKTIKIGRKNDIRQILDWIYKDADLKLERKFLKYQDIVNKDRQN